MFSLKAVCYSSESFFLKILVHVNSYQPALNRVRNPSIENSAPDGAPISREPNTAKASPQDPSRNQKAEVAV